MKKTLITICTCVLALSAQAQILKLPDGFISGKTVWMLRFGGSINNVTGDLDDYRQSWEDGKPNKKWNCSGDFNSAMGGNISLGFNKSFGSGPIYWGMEIGVGMRGYKTEVNYAYGSSSTISGGYDSHTMKESGELNAYHAQFSPISIGYRYVINESMAVDIHVGGFASYDFAGELKSESEDHIYITSKYGNNTKNTYTDNSTKIGDLDDYRKYDFGVIGGIGFWYGHLNLDLGYQRGFMAMFDYDKKLYCTKIQMRLGYAF